MNHMKIYEQFEDEESWWEEESPYEKIHKPIIGTEKFTRFLIDYNIYDKFVFNVKKYMKIRCNKDVDIDEISIIVGENPKILNCFIWNDTEEGYIFWKNIAKNWD